MIRIKDDFMAKSTGNFPYTSSEGKVCLAGLTASWGCFVMGALNTGSIYSLKLKTFLVFSNAVGPLSGRVTLGVIAWATSWLLLALIFKGRVVYPFICYILSCFFIAGALIQTFPWVRFFKVSGF